MLLKKLFDLLIYALTHVATPLDQRVIVAPKEAGALIVLGDGAFETYMGVANPDSPIVQNRLFMTPFLYSDEGKPSLQFVHAELARLTQEARAAGAESISVPKDINQN